ncbi:MAG: MSMEG_0565 family glycosyltransferase [Anaerolineae bacterium]|nr:MSMEG_0565 family glycosyltransferase [Anaerolineae bacterium]
MSKIKNPKSLRIALFTYSTKPRGGAVHTLALAEHLQALGHQVHIYALSKPGQTAFFRPTTAPFTLIPSETREADEPMDVRIQRYIQAYYEFLTNNKVGSFDIYHAQDCISANALWRLRTDGQIPWFVRTIHHLDDFISPALIQCQDHSIYRPDYRIVVSRYWQQRLTDEFNLETTVIHNGVDVTRFQPPTPAQRVHARAELGLDDQLVFLNIGGIEPRKNTIRLLRAFQSVRQKLAAQGRPAVLILGGGATLLDYEAYRQEFFELLDRSDLRRDQDVFILGVLPEARIPLLYHAADVLTFPSVKEGWGLVVLEAMASGVAALASDLPVFREYLSPEENALLVDPSDEQPIAAGMLRLAEDSQLRQRLAAAGLATAQRFSWAATAQTHVNYYHTLFPESESTSQQRITKSHNYE